MQTFGIYLEGSFQLAQNRPSSRRGFAEEHPAIADHLVVAAAVGSDAADAAVVHSTDSALVLETALVVGLVAAVAAVPVAEVVEVAGLVADAVVAIGTMVDCVHQKTSLAVASASAAVPAAAVAVVAAAAAVVVFVTVRTPVAAVVAAAAAAAVAAAAVLDIAAAAAAAAVETRFVRYLAL